jgi:hypothetical protein
MPQSDEAPWPFDPEKTSADQQSCVERVPAEESAHMAEEIVWRGSPSQWKNAGYFAVCAILGLVILCVVVVSTLLFPQTVPFNHLLLVLLLFPTLAAVKHFLITRSIVYELTTER